jgi:Zn-dependent peptidase ImmA (M78 family)
MTTNVPYLSEEEIEHDAAALIAEYAAARTITIEPPIPIEDIVEKYLKIGIEFDDAHRLFGVPRSGPHPDILGALFFDERRIVIDESLDPEEYPSMEGRYRFTLAHEGGGHWRLHRRLFDRHPDQACLFDKPKAPLFVCRTSQAKARVEWQADFYASCLLMPRKLVFAAWDQTFRDRKQRVLRPTTKIDHPFVEVERFACSIPDGKFTESEDQILERFAKPFAEKFGVSSIAMRIRLENLGLLHRVVPGQRLIEKLDRLALDIPSERSFF